MIILNKKTWMWWACGILAATVLTGVFFSAQTGIMIGILLVIAGFFIENLSLTHDLRNHIVRRLIRVESEIDTIKNGLAAKAGLPFVGKYLQLHEGKCPLFKHAAAKVYHNALLDLDLLAQYQLYINKQEEVFYWLEILFCQISSIKEIKALSFGEFREWQMCDTWWMKNYLRLHETAQKRGTQIERIFIVRSNNHVRGVEDAFRNNVKHHVRVKMAMQGQIKSPDMQNSNCLLFYNEQGEPIYALVAQLNQKGDFGHAVIYGDPQKVRMVANSYHRIDSVSELYPPVPPNQQLPRKTA